MSASNESLRVRVHRRPGMPWAVATIALAVMAAGVGSYLIFRTSSGARSPAVSRPAPAVATPIQPLQPAATPAGPRIPEVAGVEGPTVGGAKASSSEPLRPGSHDAAPSLREPICATIRGGPC
jgi:hypothetical protein